MNKLKKLITMVVAMAMVLATGMTAFAATTNITITDKNGDTGSTYVAYKLLNATEAEVAEGEDRKVAYTLNEKYTSVLQAVTGQTEQADIIAYIQDADAKTFADAVYAQVKDVEADYTTTSNAFTGVDQGYYLIVETVSDGTYSLVMLDTAGKDTLTVTTKEDVPTLTKKVKETNDTTGVTSDWQDGADYDIGDKVPFQLTGTLPSTYADYAKYKYVFHDTLSAGLTFNDDVVVKVDGTTLTTGYTVVTDCTDGCSFEVQIADLKALTEVTATAASVITVDYTATLNENAVIGMAGNTNIAKLQYSSNPYYNGSGSSDNPDNPDSPDTPDEPTSETPEDNVIVFTYELDVHKIDANQNPLKGAGFTLFKLNADGEYVAVGDEVKGEDLTDFVFKGLDAGEYKLEETTVPSGYNKADDVEFEISATYDTEADDPTFTKLEIKGATTLSVADDDTALIETTIENVSGILLPSTGGIGTTIFYIVGALIMVAAAVFLIKNKRTAK